MFILEFKQWIEEELLIEAARSATDIFPILLNNIKLDSLFNTDGKNIIQLINSITEKIKIDQKISINNDEFLKAFINTVINKSLRTREFNSIIDPNFLKLNEKDQETQIDAAKAMIKFLLKDLDEKSSIFGNILVTQDLSKTMNQKLSKSISDFFINPHGKHISLGHAEKPLFKSLFAVPKNQRKDDSIGSFYKGEDDSLVIPTEDERLPRRDSSAGTSADKIKTEFDDETRLEEHEFQRKLLEVTVDNAKEKLNSYLEQFLKKNKNDIINSANLEKFAVNPQGKTPDVNNVNNYLKIKALYDIGTKFDKKDANGKTPIGELEDHSSNPAYEGRSYASLPDRKDVLASDSYFSKLTNDQWKNLISKYILSHYNVDKDPKIVIRFFNNLYGSPKQDWIEVVHDAVEKSKKVKKDLLEKYFPPIRGDFEEYEDDGQKKKNTTGKVKFKRVWTDMSKNLESIARSDLEDFLPDVYRANDEIGKPKEKGEFDQDGRDTVIKILNNFYYNKYYGNTSASKAGVQTDDSPLKTDNKLQLFQKQLRIYRILLGLSAIEIVKEEENYSGKIPLCKQLQMWLESSYRDPDSDISFEEYTKIKEIKKIKELLKVNKNIISNIFNKPLEDICNNDVFTVEKGEDEFEIEDNDAVAKEKRKEYSFALASGYFTGGKLSFQDFLALKNSKNKEDIEEYKALISKGQKSLKNEPSLDRKKREEYLRIAREIALNKGIDNPNTIDAIAEKLKKGVPMESPLWHDLQSVKYGSTPTTSTSNDRDNNRITRSSEIPQLPETERIGSEWKPIEPKEPDPKEKEQMIAAAKQRAQAAADQRRAYYARNLNKDTGEIR